jgi:hypothetical protein
MRHVIGYLDGGSISMLVAAIGGGMAGLGVFIRAVWHRIGRRMRRNSSPQVLSDLTPEIPHDPDASP